MNRTLMIVLAVTALDAVGIGLAMPVLPSLLRDVAHSEDVAGHYGMLLSLYALMQVFFAPVMGRMSDRFGRKPILLGSLIGAAIDYAIMSAAPHLWVLYVGRILSGMMGATMAVAGASVADTVEEGTRAQAFGWLGACYGGGMILGPVIGGALGNVSPTAPFAAAAAINGLMALSVFLLMREVRRTTKPEPQTNEPFGTLLPSGVQKGLKPLLWVFFLLQLVGQIPAALWVIFTEDRFHWDTTYVGLSLAAFGLLHALFQWLGTGRLVATIGAGYAIIIGMAADGLGMATLALATEGWMVVPILVLLAFGGIAMPALQSVLSDRTSQNKQGALQGTLASLTNISAVAGPIIFTALYMRTAASWNGWVWLVGPAIYLVAAPSLVFVRRQSAGLPSRR
ncbi:Tet(A)/Tet(B)/Tet(C) family tetracycline efflux MFS transporter [Brucella oryzae]|uniref:Tet(A)/Tet(B)/Tet(C) family tetracycline efflux MFS transporter n=1 Tax=Brucella oryzae TaxID=335286 RepID=A0A2S7IZ23_9HYPH|nr:Tet(A)/Tet(B)/Tet(C) family tetracycline efflux MFS transporter [Brucella oryzae]PQA73255.1 Tet(A)/Tet(B)/Tet(C) family tetracycline efflux MFS transporter [Brucella oryzae]